MADFDDDIEDGLPEDGDAWDDDDMLITDDLYLDRPGFEAEELALKAPSLNYLEDFSKYMAAEAVFNIFNIWDDQIPEGLKEHFEEACQDFVEHTLTPAVEDIGGWGWFDSCFVNVSYDMLSGDIWLTLSDLTRSEIEYDPDALTAYAPSDEAEEVEDKEASEKEALQSYGETDIEVDKVEVEAEAEADEGEGDLAEWIFDAMTNNLALAGRGNVSVNDMDQIADKCADICGQDIDKFDTLKFRVEDDGDITSFDFNGSHYELDL